ncbi:MAG: sigma factor G inhibitor Gin [Syntrophomonadaceae bacterium]
MIIKSLSPAPTPAHRDCVVPRCSVCHQIPRAGIRGGLKLCKAFLCQECESILMATPVGSSDYHRIMAGLRSVY